MLFKEVRTLQTRGSVDPGPDEEVDGILMVATETIATWGERHSVSGHDQVRVYPAVHNGQRVWLFEYDWYPALGYCATGAYEIVIDFETGVKRLLEHGAFEHLWAAK